jgi:hypothetical protein
MEGQWREVFAQGSFSGAALRKWEQGMYLAEYLDNQQERSEGSVFRQGQDETMTK